MIKNSPNDIVDLVKIANYLDQTGDLEHSDELTKVAQNLLYHLTEPDIIDKEKIMKDIIAELDD